MMKFILILLLSLPTAAAYAQQGTTSSINSPDAGKKTMVVDASCGQCRLGLPGQSCDLAVRLDGKAYFVDGTTVDSHGDAHAPDGLCQTIRKAEVQGELVDNRFKATYFRLLPDAVKAK
ncbi:hypothetical protein LJY25_09860 [Hymenobacter sp. BT175]|uniref:DUF6370 family protein n=1 Tax=Hymenobacter translucens TaxID=2886507 RepID=UPI001D0E79A5|nr:DUF6370 family protein [Hymenobacter translucens]MCC2546747.1 hypothetical protein [Hymenobacter translucens]